MATLTIGIARPEDRLPDNTIKIYCKTCDDSTLHERRIRDWDNRKILRKPKRGRRIPMNNPYGKALWECLGCGEIHRF